MIDAQGGANHLLSEYCSCFVAGCTASYFSFNDAWAAASRAIGTLNGEQLT